ncbi:MAG: DUF2256 domain-containing protein [Betaproteobacteria bacterium]|nr:DUF2256 domain-containing protein [Betaproteobacteria bacterium]
MGKEGVTRFASREHLVLAPRGEDFRGNKARLASKPCAACGRLMSWRRRWARCWAEVRYCSAACRRDKAGRGQ